VLGVRDRLQLQLKVQLLLLVLAHDLVFVGCQLRLDPGSLALQTLLNLLFQFQPSGHHPLGADRGQIVQECLHPRLAVAAKLDILGPKVAGPLLEHSLIMSLKLPALADELPLHGLAQTAHLAIDPAILGLEFLPGLLDRRLHALLTLVDDTPLVTQGKEGQLLLQDLDLLVQLLEPLVVPVGPEQAVEIDHSQVQVLRLGGLTRPGDLRVNPTQEDHGGQQQGRGQKRGGPPPGRPGPRRDAHTETSLAQGLVPPAGG